MMHVEILFLYRRSDLLLFADIIDVVVVVVVVVVNCF